MSSFIQDKILKKAIDVLFLKYDKDRSNTLDINQLTGAFNTLLGMVGVPSMATSFVLGQLIKRMDKDQDGKINKPEFLTLFRLFQAQQQELKNQNQGNWGQQQNQGGWNQPQQNQGGWNQPQQNQGGWGNQPQNQGGWNQPQQNQGGWGNQPNNFGNQGGFGNQGPGSGFGY